jgi:CheY-like chemotaxis protein
MPRLDGTCVLVVDDDEDALSLLSQLLANVGASTETATSAAEALEKVRRIRPDVIVSDIGMPNVDGYDLMRRVRRLPASEGGRTPAIAVTAYARPDDAERAFAAGFQRHVPKPIDPGEMVFAVANLAGLPLHVD